MREKTEENQRYGITEGQEWSKTELENLTILDYYKAKDQERSKKTVIKVTKEWFIKGVKKHGNQ